MTYQTHLARFERATFGLVDRCDKNVNPVKSKTYVTTAAGVTQKLTPTLQQANLDMAELPQELAEIIEKWDKLPDHIKQTIQTLVGSVTIAGNDNVSK